MAAKKNAAAKDLRTPKYRQRVVQNLKKAYLRRPKHPARAAESFSASGRGPAHSPSLPPRAAVQIGYTRCRGAAPIEIA